ncbi:MAG: hypothetical protein KDN20_15260 [Verrucomicrobiae bacterium]|nr:hypothetical protein [Verrucomicrobiae bacterium]
MGILLRQLDLRVTTDSGEFGASIPFSKGLNVFWADNSMGKSTSVQGIIFALGLERMLSPQGVIPLPYVMTQYVEENGAKNHAVLNSDVYLELENNKGEVITIRRTVVGQRDAKLVTVWRGSVLRDGDSSYEGEDFFVRDPGAASRKAGFHRFLAEFMGWELPIVKRSNGDDVLLYLECIFPLLIVEQKRGWGGIQANMPTYFGIRDVNKRAIEFLADLDASGVAHLIQELKFEEERIRQRWVDSLEIAGVYIEGLGGKIVNIPDYPTTDWPTLVRPTIELSVGGKRVLIDSYILELKSEIEKFDTAGIPTAGEAAPANQDELDQQFAQLRSLESTFQEVERELQIERHLNNKLLVRLEALDEDIRKNRDHLKLQNLGSKLGISVADKNCPACHRKLTDILLPDCEVDTPMSVEDNIKFIESQKDAFVAMLANSEKLIEEKALTSSALRRDIVDTKSTIRSLRATLVSDSRVPSVSAIRKQLSKEQLVETLEKANARIDELVETFTGLSRELSQVIAKKNKIRNNSGLTIEDESKLSSLEANYVAQLKEYRLRSVQPTTITISRESYRPIREGFNLGFDLSASDNIRSIWAYLVAFLEISRNHTTHHPGLVIFDEPRQQETSDFSFTGFLKRASNSIDHNQQVILATSEKFVELQRALTGIPHSLHKIDGRVIKRIV